MIGIFSAIFCLLTLINLAHSHRYSPSVLIPKETNYTSVYCDQLQCKPVTEAEMILKRKAFQKKRRVFAPLRQSPERPNCLIGYNQESGNFCGNCFVNGTNFPSSEIPRSCSVFLKNGKYLRSREWLANNLPATRHHSSGLEKRDWSELRAFYFYIHV